MAVLLFPVVLANTFLQQTPTCVNPRAALPPPEARRFSRPRF